MKRIAAAVTAVLCVMGCMAFVPFSTSYEGADVSITASAATTVEEVAPGVNASKYSYEYADTLVYQYSCAAIKIDPKSKSENVAALAKKLAGDDGKGYDATSSGKGGVLQETYVKDGYKINIFCVTMSCLQSVRN